MHILHLHLATTMLAQQHAFYTQVFGFPVLTTTSDSITLQAGESQLMFTHVAEPAESSYHFAFNIPENQFATAKTWLSQRVPLLADSTGTDTFAFDDWNAHAMYCYDPAGNIIELIARHSLDNANDRPFVGQHVVNISEIGIAAEDVPMQVAMIQAELGTAIYDGGGSHTFTAVGDEHGLLIVVQRGRIWFPDTGRPANHVPILVEVLNNDHQRTLRFE